MNTPAPALVLSDAKIERIVVDPDGMTISLSDWQESKLRVRFTDVLAVKALSPIGAEISGLRRIDTDPLRDEALAASGEDGLEVHCYIFDSAWGDEGVLTIVARECETFRT